MLKKFVIALALAATAALGTLPATAAQEPSMNEVYQAAKDGRYIEAQSMMDQVLKAHPNSAKAHYVEAELLAKQGLLSRAGDALRTAERLEPGLPFAKADAVEKLRTMIATPRTSPPSGTSLQTSQPSFTNQAARDTSGGIPWGLVLGGVGLVAFIAFATRFMRQRKAASMAPVAGYANAYPQASPGMQPQGFGQNYGVGPAGQAMGPAAGPGMGAGIMGGLATGAALGAGMVAGQALMHHFTDGDRGGSAATPPPAGNHWNSEPANDMDMGGDNFGVADSSSWDDGGSSGGDGGGDWN